MVYRELSSRLWASDLGSFNPVLSKGPLTTTWTWNLHSTHANLKHVRCNGKNATSKILDVIGGIHDVETFQGVQNSLELNQILFASHWSHLSIIFLWAAGTLFHIGWTGNFSYWKLNPISTIPLSHSIWDPHFAASYESSTPSYSGVYNWIYAAGFQTEFELYYFVLACELLALSSLLLGKIHMNLSQSLTAWYRTNNSINQSHKLSSKTLLPIRFSSSYMESSGLRLNFHLAILIGLSSSLWAGHLVHVSIPASRGSLTHKLFLDSSDSNLIYHISKGSWHAFMVQADSPSHVFGHQEGSGSSLLTFLGGIAQPTNSLYLSDIAHHHLAIGVLFIWSGQLYSSLYKALGHRSYNILATSGLTLASRYVIKSLHLQLSLALLSLSVATSIVSQQLYSMPAYPYLAYDYVTTTSLFVHHNWIASFLMIGAFSHSALFLLRDYTGLGTTLSSDVFSRLLAHKASLISHLSWASLFLGFHTLGLYVHNDSVVAFGQPYKQILIEPLLAQSFMTTLSGQAFSYGLPEVDLFELSNLKPFALSDFQASSIGPGDFLVYHAVSLGLHVTSLILIKGSLDSRGSSLLPDKSQFGYGFSCDGPSRGGTCDISSWDAFYLAMFWLLNSNSWLMFYFHWKHLLVWQSLSLKFEESSTYLNGWFRDYLWFNSSSLIRGYDASGSNDISVWSWSFLAAHLCWATGFMFLISWRGYWQELIETITYMHLKTPFVYDLWDGSSYSPTALSIVQARFIGLVHFSSGFIITYAAFVLGATS